MQHSDPSYTETMPCQECGSIIRVQTEICPQCGTKNTPVVTSLGRVELNGKNRIVIALFALCLGSFGAHKFYLKQIGLGVLYLVFYWTLIPLIASFIECILLLAMSDQAFIDKYGKDA